MAAELRPRNNDESCVHDAFVHSYNAGLLVPSVSEIIQHVPDNFPINSLRQLCSMLRTELHVNCSSMVPSREPLIQIFANPINPKLNGEMGGHFEFLRPVDLDSYRVELPHLILVGFIAFREIECTPLKHAPEKHHIPKDMSTMQAREEALAA